MYNFCHDSSDISSNDTLYITYPHLTPMLGALSNFISWLAEHVMAADSINSPFEQGSEENTGACKIHILKSTTHGYEEETCTYQIQSEIYTSQNHIIFIKTKVLLPQS